MTTFGEGVIVSTFLRPSVARFRSRLGPPRKPAARVPLTEAFPAVVLAMVVAIAAAHAQPPPAGFVTPSGADLILAPSGPLVCLRGQGLATDLLRDPSDPSADWQRNSPDDSWVPVTDWYDESDVASLAGYGFDVLRLALNYRLFEDDGAPCTCDLASGECDGIFSFPSGHPCNYVNSVWQQDPLFASGWDYLDHWITWASTHDVYLILDMHTPPGGLQLSLPGTRLWTDPANADRLLRLWRAIARRYADEPRIAGFDLLNEPAPAEPSPSLATARLWPELASRILGQIRIEDPYHLVVVERLLAITDEALVFYYDDYTLPMESSWFLVDDARAIYDFHFYWPMINHQANWGLCGGTGGYPVPSVLEPTFLGQPDAPCDLSGLDGQLAAFAAFGARNRIPTSVSEWGGGDVGGDIFDHAGSAVYIQDVLGLLESRFLHWSFFYANLLHVGSDQTLPFDPARTQLFSTYFAGAGCQRQPVVFADGFESGGVGRWSLHSG